MRTLAQHNVKAEVLHRGVEVLLHHRGQPVNLVDEEKVSLLEPRHDAR